MEKRLCLVITIFMMAGLRAFATGNDEVKRGEFYSESRVRIDDTLPELIDNIEVSGERIRGVVYFEGFDFERYAPETGGIELMLEETLKLLKKNYEADKTPFVFLGHSQGGLRALAMSTSHTDNVSC